jgi:uncharacterized protein (DUF2249 family)
MKPLILDVRPIFKQGGSPCEPIDQAVASLKKGQDFVLLVPFEPTPLFAKLARQGFRHESKQLEDGAWSITFQKKDEENKKILEKEGMPSEKNRDLHLDTRGLEPPEPLVKTIEALKQLGKKSKLFMHSDRKPMHLFTQLDERNVAYDCTEQPDHSFITKIWYPDDAA